MMIRIKYIGEDDWGRRTYRNVDTGMIYKDVDGVLHTSTKSIGEPDCPLRKDVQIIEVV
jgi:hypothetical protein